MSASGEAFARARARRRREISQVRFYRIAPRGRSPAKAELAALVAAAFALVHGQCGPSCQRKALPRS